MAWSRDLPKATGLKTDLLLLSLKHRSSHPFKEPKTQEQRTRPQLLLPALSCTAHQNPGFPKTGRCTATAHRNELPSQGGLFKTQGPSEAGLEDCICHLHITLPAQTHSLTVGRLISGRVSHVFLLPSLDLRNRDAAKANRSEARPTLLAYLYLQVK